MDAGREGHGSHAGAAGTQDEGGPAGIPALLSLLAVVAEDRIRDVRAASLYLAGLARVRAGTPCARVARVAAALSSRRRRRLTTSAPPRH